MVEYDDNPIKDKIQALERKNQTLTRRFETISEALGFAEKRIYELKAKCEKLEAEKNDAVKALLFAMIEFSKKTDGKENNAKD